MELILNQEEQEDREIEVTVSVTLSKTMKIKVNDYVSFGEDEYGFPDIEYSLCDLKKAVKEEKYLPQDAYRFVDDSDIKEDLKDWIVDDFEVVID